MHRTFSVGERRVATQRHRGEHGCCKKEVCTAVPPAWANFETRASLVVTENSQYNNTAHVKQTDRHNQVRMPMAYKRRHVSKPTLKGALQMLFAPAVIMPRICESYSRELVVVSASSVSTFSIQNLVNFIEEEAPRTRHCRTAVHNK